MQMKIAVVGMGYVGQTLAVVLADSGHKVYGVELDENVINGIKSGTSHVHEEHLNHFIKKHLNKNFFIGRPEEMYSKDFDAFIVSVATPINKETKKPNMEILKNSINEIKNYLGPGKILILRSTVPVGTTRNVVIPIIEQSGLKAGRDFCVAYAPERTAEGVALKELKTLPQVIGGYDDESLLTATKIFIQVTPTVIRVSSLEAAEVIKLLDNSYRDVVFAYSNEISKYCQKAGLNAFEIIRSANYGYPRNNIPLPSPGVGGACLSKDPHIFADSAMQKGVNLSLIRNARQINETMVMHVVETLKNHTSLTDKKIVICGFAFKGHPETKDVRESPTLYLLEHLKDEGAKIYGYDPLVDRKEIEDLGVEYVDNLESGMDGMDIAIFMINHRSFVNMSVKDVFSRLNKKGVVYDGWGLFNKHEVEELGLRYMGIGVS